MKEEILEHIRKVCNLKVLRFGCLVRLKENNRIKVIYGNSVSGWLMRQYNDDGSLYTDNTVVTISNKEDFEIIGLPVCLNDLLFAIQKKRCNY